MVPIRVSYKEFLVSVRNKEFTIIILIISKCVAIELTVAVIWVHGKISKYIVN